MLRCVSDAVAWVRRGVHAPLRRQRRCALLTAFALRMQRLRIGPCGAGSIADGDVEAGALELITRAG